MGKGGVERRLRKIDKNEAASLKLLEKQETDLAAAVDENDRLVEERLGWRGQAEGKMMAEVDKLTKKVSQVNIELDKVS